MASSHTAEDVEKNHVEVLGPDLGPLYHRLWNECAWIHLKWKEYQELFGKSEERVDLLNRTAGAFFRMIQDSLWEDTLLHIARLVDRPSVAGKANLTIQRLPDLVDEEVHTEMSDLVDAAVEASVFAVDWRNRKIAHRDLKLALAEGAQPLAKATGQGVDVALETIAAALNRIALHYFDSTVIYDAGVGALTGAEALLHVIRDGVEADAARRQRLSDGKLNEEDLGPPRPL